MDLLLRKGSWQHRVNLNLSDGGSTARYYASISYLDEEGMYNTDKALKDDYNTNANYRRYNYRLNTDIIITKTTLLKLGVSGWLSKRNSRDWVMQMYGVNFLAIPPFVLLYFIPTVVFRQ